MSALTDREKLVELLGDNVCEHDDCKNCEHFATVYPCVNYIKQRMVGHLIANGVTFAKNTDVPTKWISVKERLPEDIRDVLVFHKLSRCGYCDRAWYDSDAKKWHSALSMNMKVTHWMPLPEPPEE